MMRGYPLRQFIECRSDYGMLMLWARNQSSKQGTARPGRRHLIMLSNDVGVTLLRDRYLIMQRIFGFAVQYIYVQFTIVHGVSP
jgi:hypothetical protein